MFLSDAFLSVLLLLVATTVHRRPSHLITAFSSSPPGALGIIMVSQILQALNQSFKCLRKDCPSVPVNIGKALGRPTGKASVQSSVHKMHLTAEPF